MAAEGCPRTGGGEGWGRVGRALGGRTTDAREGGKEAGDGDVRGHGGGPDGGEVGRGSCGSRVLLGGGRPNKRNTEWW